MNLIIICGPPASGKMTVGQELAKKTGYKLFHNHMSLELVNQFFDFGTPNFSRLDRNIRFDIFKEIADSDIEGLIFTIVWAFSEKEDEAYIDEIIEVFSQREPKVCLVELACELSERLIRNKHENRLAHKASKRDVAFSEKVLLDSEARYRMNSIEGELPGKSLLKIDNTQLSAEAVADRIQIHYQLEGKKEES